MNGKTKVRPSAIAAAAMALAILTALATNAAAQAVQLQIAVDSNGTIYVVNFNNSVTEYAAGSNGDAKPGATISGCKTGLGFPFGIAIGPYRRGTT